MVPQADAGPLLGIVLPSLCQLPNRVPTKLYLIRRDDRLETGDILQETLAGQA